MDGVPMFAGIASTVIFASSVLPMLAKAYRTRDLTSYSLGNLAMANVGNAVHSVYVLSLPPGPIWVLHAFYVVSTGLMLFWLLRYRMRRTSHAAPAEMGDPSDADPPAPLLASSQTSGGVT